MMFHWKLETHTGAARLPICVTYVPPGKHPPCQWHDHDAAEIALVLSGTARHIVQTKTGQQLAEIQTGDVLAIHPGSIHAYDNTKTLEMLNLTYDARRLPIPILDGYDMDSFRLFFPMENLPPPPPEQVVRPVMRLSPQELQEMRTHLENLAERLVCFGPGIMFEILTRFMNCILVLNRFATPIHSQKHQAPDFLMGQVLYFIGRDFNHSLTLEEMARRVHMSVRNFCRNFRLATGYAPIQYLLRQRILHAAELLKTTDQNLTDVALNCGFCNATHFSRQFQKIEGVTPGKYRRQHRERTGERKEKGEPEE